MALINGTDGPDVLFGTSEDDTLSGGGDDDYLQGGAGDDRIDGGTGSDTVSFGLWVQGVIVDLEAGTATGDGNDALDGIENVEGTGSDDVLTGNGDDNRLFGGRGADTISGGDGNDHIEGGLYFGDDGAVDRLDGGGGDDLIRMSRDDIADGGPGMDTLWIDLLQQSQGIDIDLSPMWAGGAAAVGAGAVTGFERLGFVFGSDAADIVIVGTSAIPDNDFPPEILGYAGNDWLTGGDNRDSLKGGSDDDLLVGLGGDDRLDGGDGDDRIEGGAGEDSLVGGPGADLLIGGPGSDVYVYLIDDTFPADDRIVEESGEAGADRILIHPNGAVDDSAYAGIRNVEIAELRTLQDLPGPEFILGAEFGASGIKTVIASADIDASQMTSGVEFVVTRPNIRPLIVTAGSGDDVFRFGELMLPPFVYGYVLSGGDGFDTLHLDQPLNPDWWAAKVVVSDFEAIFLAGGGDAFSRVAPANLSGPAEAYDITLTDAMMDAGTLFTVDAHELSGGANALLLDVSQLTGGRAVRVLAGAGADSLTGSAGDDALFGGGGGDLLDGGPGADRVSGEAGNDVLRGGDGTDVLDGGDGADTLQGGAGADNMLGGPGGDVYVVDATGDRIVELSGQGSDTARANVSYTLSDHVEQLVLTGGGNTNGTGNGLANMLTGNGGNNRLDGGGGADTMAGGTGHDTYVVDHAGDRVIEGGSSGTDSVESSVSYSLPVHFEKLILTGHLGYDGRGNAGANTITGNAGRNFLNGGRGNDIIDGGAGNDQLMGNLGNDLLEGGTGADRFYFNVAPGGADADRILDFSAADDSLYLLRSAFTGTGPNGTLAAGAFHNGAAAHDSSDRIVYDAATGKIFYDSDGTGAAAAILFATVAAGTPLSHADFVIYG